MASRVLWLEVTQDKYELPLAVAIDQHELARMRGTTAAKIRACYSKYKTGKSKQCRYRRVEVEE